MKNKKFEFFDPKLSFLNKKSFKIDTTIPSTNTFEKGDSINVRSKNLFLSKKNDYDTNFKDVVNFQIHDLQSLNQKVLYIDFFKTYTQFFKHTHKIIKDRSENIDVIFKDTIRRLFKKDFKFIHLEIIGNKTGKILFPKELDMFLNDEDLLKLEDQLYSSRQISDQEYIFYDQDKNIRVGSLRKNLESVYTIIFKEKTLKSDSNYTHHLDFVNIEEITCDHKWQKYTGTDNIPCVICNLFPHKRLRAKCQNCHLEACIKCLEKKELIQVEPDLINEEKDLDKQELRVLRRRIESVEDTVKFFQKKLDLFEKQIKRKDTVEENKDLILQDYLQVVCNAENLKSLKVKCKIRIDDFIINCLALVDSGCSNCILNKSLVPTRYIVKSDSPLEAQQMDGGIFSYKEILRPNSKISFETNCGFSKEYTLPPKNTFVRILNLTNIDFILGLNFLLKDDGSVTLSKDYLHFHKHTFFTPAITTHFSSKTDKHDSPVLEKPCKCKKERECQLKEEELDEGLEEILDYNEDHFIDYDLDFVSSEKLYTALVTDLDIDNLVSKLEKIGIIGEDIIKYWEKDKVFCELKIKNPEYVIKTKNIEPTNQDREDFKMHISELIKLGVIRKSDSPHRSAAFIVKNHSEIIRGKSRMVINYKRLNDNTVDDAYNIPDKTVLINKIQNCKIFSKFDLKSGFWQVKMHPDSIKWTAFTCPEGHYEWLVMPFGLKNAPSIFQRKMEDIFNKHSNFVAVYIDDILVFSKNRKDHKGHLQIVFSEFIRHGLILSKKKMQLFKDYIDFLGVNIGEGKIKLQPHIAQKALDFPNKLEDLKQLQKFLGLINYARPFIKNLGKIAGPLYAKTSPNGQKYFNQEDVKLVQQLKNEIKFLPELALPLDTDYLIIETDGCSRGWGAILLCKPHKYADKSSEKICRYSSGIYKEKGNITSIDAELLAINYALDSFEFFIISKKEITIRTDCEAIVSFYNKMKGESKRSSRRRWLNFLDRISNTGLIIEIKHIKGSDNKAADILSRLLEHKLN